jgi:membrane protein CcdC involved in cytochrome C biogenesis
VPLLALKVAPGPVLSILGPHYAGYVSDALLMAACGAMSVMNAAALGLAAARGIVMPPLLSIPGALLLQVLLVFVLPVGTVAGVLLLGLISTTAQWLMLVTYFEWRIRRGG